MKKILILSFSLFLGLCLFNKAHAQDYGAELISNADGSYTFQWDNGSSITTNTDGHYSYEMEGNCQGCMEPVYVTGYYNHTTQQHEYTWSVPIEQVTEADYMYLATTQAMMEMMPEYTEPYWTTTIEPTEVEISSSPVTSLPAMFKCFDRVPNAGATYSVKICADLPVNSDPSIIITSGLVPGHAFISMTKTNGTESVTQSFGFYPVTSWVSIFNTAIDSKLVDDGGHEYNASMEMTNISALDFQTLQNYAINKGTTLKYDLNDYNCTDYALEVFNSIRSTPLVVPDQITGGTGGNNWGTTPNGLYNVLNNLSATQSSATTGIHNVSGSRGQCY
jgi:hypothetical protein